MGSAVMIAAFRTVRWVFGPFGLKCGLHPEAKLQSGLRRFPTGVQRKLHRKWVLRDPAPIGLRPFLSVLISSGPGKCQRQRKCPLVLYHEQS
jgi:hypothetical protein